MAMCQRKHSIYIILTAITSAVALATVCTSFATQRWTDATARPTAGANVSATDSNVNYGLFGGSLVRRISNPVQYKLFITCLWKRNACAWSCENNEESRKIEIERLLNGEMPKFSCLLDKSDANAVASVASYGTDNHERVFVNAGLWLSTIIFMAFLIVALLTSLLLSIINSMKSPVEPFLNIYGIYVANGIALAANLIALILYGSSYSIFISHDIAIRDTIVGEYFSEASLGYSYWILILPCVFIGLGTFLIAMREILIRNDRAETKIDVSADVPETGVLF